MPIVNSIFNSSEFWGELVNGMSNSVATFVQITSHHHKKKCFEPFLPHCSGPFVIKSFPIKLCSDQMSFIIFQEKLVILFLIKQEFCSSQYDILLIINKNTIMTAVLRPFVLKSHYDILLITVLTAVLRSFVLKSQYNNLLIDHRFHSSPEGTDPP